jgi:hypothetical protein
LYKATSCGEGTLLVLLVKDKQKNRKEKEIKYNWLMNPEI